MNKFSYYLGALMGVTMVVLAQAITGRPIGWWTPFEWLVVFCVIEGIIAAIRELRRGRKWRAA